MSRIILLAGTGGAGTSTLAAATLAALRDEGVTAALLNAGDDAGDVAAAQATLASALIPLQSLLGADAVPPEAWDRLPGLAGLAALLTCQELAETNEAVVVDAGSLANARALIALPGVLVRLLDAALTPRLAMLRGPAGDEGVFPALSNLRLQVLALTRLLERERTTMRLVMPAEPAAVPRIRQAIGDIAGLGVGVEAVIVNRYPRAGEGWPEPVMAAARRALAEAATAAEGLPVWKSTSRLRPSPKGHSALGPFGRVAVLDAAQLTVRVSDEALEWDLPLPASARETAHVGVCGESLVIDLLRTSRWIDLPPVLTRCRPEIATRTPDGITIRFRADPGRWPSHLAPGEEGRS